MSEHEVEPPVPDPPLAGLGAFAKKVAVGTVLAALAVVAGLKLYGSKSGSDESARPAPRSAHATMPARRSRPELGPPSATAVSGPVGAIARETERRHAGGELSEAAKSFPPCPGGDLRRVGWIDRAGVVFKLLRERADGAVIEEWFDEEGRLREAMARGTGSEGAWSRHVILDASGAEAGVPATDEGAAPSGGVPLVRRDPQEAFFSGAGCTAPR